MMYDKVYVCFHSSDMVLHIDLHTAYLVLSKVKSRITVYYFLSNYSSPNILLTLNGAILVEYKGMKHVVTSLAKAETLGVFHNT